VVGVVEQRARNRDPARLVGDAGQLYVEDGGASDAERRRRLCGRGGAEEAGGDRNDRSTKPARASPREHAASIAAP
jgi:hypothetical protein